MVATQMDLVKTKATTYQHEALMLISVSVNKSDWPDLNDTECLSNYP